MFKLLKCTESAYHSERFAISVNTRLWGISVWCDYDHWNNCKFLIVQFLCFRFKWEIYKRKV